MTPAPPATRFSYSDLIARNYKPQPLRFALVHSPTGSCFSTEGLGRFRGTMQSLDRL